MRRNCRSRPPHRAPVQPGDESDPDASRAAASDAYYLCAKENIQTHGGMGFTWEVDCHLFYRRAKLLALQAGAPAVWKEKLVRRLEQRNAA